MILNSIYALLASFLFGIIFNIKGNNLIFASVGGAIGWFFYSSLINENFSKLFALFVASVSISIYCEAMARLLKAPVTIFMVCAVIPIVPGAGTYYTMYEMTRGNINKSLQIGIETIFSALIIVVATMLVASLTKVVLMLIKSHKA